MTMIATAPASRIIATKEDVEAFAGSCVWLRSQWVHFTTLFEGTDLQRELLESTAHTFFSDLNHMFIEHLVLHICRLTDNAESLGRENLTVKFLIEHSDFSNATWTASNSSGSGKAARQIWLPLAARSRVQEHHERLAARVRLTVLPLVVNLRQDQYLKINRRAAVVRRHDDVFRHPRVCRHGVVDDSVAAVRIGRRGDCDPTGRSSRVLQNGEHNQFARSSRGSMLPKFGIFFPVWSSFGCRTNFSTSFKPTVRFLSLLVGSFMPRVLLVLISASVRRV